MEGMVMPFFLITIFIVGLCIWLFLEDGFSKLSQHLKNKIQKMKNGFKNCEHSWTVLTENYHTKVIYCPACDTELTLSSQKARAMRKKEQIKKSYREKTFQELQEEIENYKMKLKEYELFNDELRKASFQKKPPAPPNARTIR